jgi:hypothetical protein
MPEMSSRNPQSIVPIAAALVLAVLVSAPHASSAASGGDVRSRIFTAFAGLKSYRLTVLGSVRSLGVWVSPNKYQMTTEFEGKPIKTLIVGQDYWTLANGKWEKSGTAGKNLDVDIAGLIRNAKANPKTPFVKLPDQTQDGKRVGAFEYTFKDGTEETCNYDPATYLVTRCKADELTLLYSGYNDPANRVATPQ